MIRVLIVDDHPSTAEGLAGLLAREEDIEVVGIAATVAQATELIRSSTPDVVLCDILLQGETGGFDVLRSIHPEHAAAVLFLSSFDYPALQQHALGLGARGYLLKDSSVREIVDAIRRVVAGGTAFSVAAFRDAQTPRPPSRRELELIRLVRAGLSNDEAAVRLDISTRGVESSLRRLFQRYGVMSRTELVGVAEEQGWTALPAQGGDR